MYLSIDKCIVMNHKIYFFGLALFCTVRHCSAPFSIVRHRSPLFGTVWHRLAPFGTVWTQLGTVGHKWAPLAAAGTFVLILQLVAGNQYPCLIFTLQLGNTDYLGAMSPKTFGLFIYVIDLSSQIFGINNSSRMCHIQYFSTH